jgi:hypothetical protein
MAVVGRGRGMVVVAWVMVVEVWEMVAVGMGMVAGVMEVKVKVEEVRVEEVRVEVGRAVEEMGEVKGVKEEKGWVVAEIQGQVAWVGVCSSTSNRCHIEPELMYFFKQLSGCEKLCRTLHSVHFTGPLTLDLVVGLEVVMGWEEGCTTHKQWACWYHRTITAHEYLACKVLGSGWCSTEVWGNQSCMLKGTRMHELLA